ncbi:uncharacterized protein N7458_002536 [Penicillium daleae]|uniref:Uncharacterized protein n=1 Tax=Penicillium daleae TaxID=63821 RepID=A0AAD6CDQ2_9EURO|nr:uncharacterized protein N7458_002536 [Penicillium daleae]KAJ5460984.1 hypothetical protein N7458_002536 [Penicillium daleae]
MLRETFWVRGYCAHALSAFEIGDMVGGGGQHSSGRNRLEEDVEVEKRSGKPFSSTVDVDRYALSAKSVQRSWTTQVTAGFLRRSVFKAFVSFLIGDGQSFNQALAADGTLVYSDEAWSKAT